MRNVFRYDGASPKKQLALTLLAESKRHEHLADASIAKGSSSLEPWPREYLDCLPSGGDFCGVAARWTDEELARLACPSFEARARTIRDRRNALCAKLEPAVTRPTKINSRLYQRKK